jgi:two-component system LytT family response regulator
MRSMPARVAIHLADGTILLSVKEILYCCAESNYTYIHATGERRYLLSKTLRQVEEKLPSMQFLRIHQSPLVNLNSIECISAHVVRMHDQRLLPLARGRRKVLLQKLENLTISM